MAAKGYVALRLGSFHCTKCNATWGGLGAAVAYCFPHGPTESWAFGCMCVGSRPNATSHVSAKRKRKAPNRQRRWTTDANWHSDQLAQPRDFFFFPSAPARTALFIGISLVPSAARQKIHAASDTRSCRSHFQRGGLRRGKGEGGLGTTSYLAYRACSNLVKRHLASRGIARHARMNKLLPLGRVSSG